MASTLRDRYQVALTRLSNNQIAAVDLSFDDARREFAAAWEPLHAEISNQPGLARDRAAGLIKAMPQTLGLSLGLGRLDVVGLGKRHKSLLEYICNAASNNPGFMQVNGLTGVASGFSYMLTATTALANQSWRLLSALFEYKYEWYYMSGTPRYSYGFATSYFFHSETFDRSASDVHDFYRKLLDELEVPDILGFNPEQLKDYYMQTQFLMCLRAALLVKAGKDVRMWADFGRFYSQRITPMLERAYHDPEFRVGVCSVLQTDPEKFVGTVNESLQLIHSRFWGGSGFWWESLGSWEPKD